MSEYPAADRVIFAMLSQAADNTTLSKTQYRCKDVQTEKHVAD